MAYEQLKLSNQVCFRLYTASRLVIQAYKPFFDKLGITYPQYLVLMVLWENDNMPVNDIAKKLVLETNTVTPLIQRMETLGLITRAKSQSDSRRTIVSLTRKGRSMEKEAAEIPNCMAGMLMSNGVNEKSIFDMIPGLDNIIVHLKGKKAK